VQQQGSPVTPASLRIGSPGDSLEREANMVADDQRQNLSALKSISDPGLGRIRLDRKPASKQHDFVTVPWVDDHVTSLFNYISQFDQDPEHALTVAREIARRSILQIGGRTIPRDAWEKGSAKAGSFGLSVLFLNEWFDKSAGDLRAATTQAKFSAAAQVSAERKHVAQMVTSSAAERRAKKERPRTAYETQAVISNWKVLEANAPLARLYLTFLEHFAGLTISSENRAAAADGLNQTEIGALIGDDPTLAYFTDLFTQGYTEFKAAGGAEQGQFQNLEETIFQQYVWGNPTAQANQLAIGHGYGYRPEESQILGIIRRSSGLLLYGGDGKELPTMVGLLTARDPGFRAAKPLVSGLGIEVTDPATQLMLAALRENFADPILIVSQGARAYFDNITVVNDQIADGLGKTIVEQLKDSLKVLVGFLLGNAAATLLTKLGHPILVGIGLGLKALIKAAEWLMNIDLVATALVTVVTAAEHLVRVTKSQKGKTPDELSSGHLNSAAKILTPMIAQIAITFGALALSGLIGRLRKGKGSAEIRCSDCTIVPKDEAAKAPEKATTAEAAPEPAAKFSREVFRRVYEQYLASGAEAVGPERGVFPDPTKYPTVEVRPNGDVFGRYDELAKFGQDAGMTGKRGPVGSIEGHHLLEDNYMEYFGVKRADGRSVGLESADHAIFSKEVPAELGGRTPKKFFDIWDLFNAHAKVYRENGHPEWVAEMIRFLRDQKSVIKDAYVGGKVPGSKLPDYAPRVSKALDFLNNL
jgi:hypothetical protein